MDAPFDNRNIYDWHQDSAYDGVNSVPTNGCILWVPLVDTNEKNGTLIVCPGSQIEPSHIFETKKPSLGVSRQITTPSQVVAKYEKTSVSANAGDCLTSYANLIHKSGTNSSKNIRFTLVVRFNKITEDFYLFKKVNQNLQ